jgi:hypothetical protein
MSVFFKDGAAPVGGKEMAFTRRKVRGGYLMWLPQSFCEDAAIVSNYSYFYSKEKSPLSVAVKYSLLTALADKSKMLESYFSQPPEQEGGAYYRETVTLSQYMSVYSLRFAKDVGEGMLFGCFNCSADYSGDWKPVVLEILKNVEKN